MASLKISSLIAAAGLSRRMGFPKALMPLCGEPAAVLLARQFSHAKLAQIFVTLPQFLLKDSRLNEELLSLGVQVMPNRYDYHGYAGSIATTIEELDASYNGIFITPIDAPYPGTGLILAMTNLAQRWAPGPCIIVPMCELGPAHPVYVSSHFFAALAQCHLLGGLRGFIAQHPAYIRRLYWPDKRILANLNYLSQIAAPSGQNSPP